MILHLYVLLSINDRIIFRIKIISTFNRLLMNKYNYIMEYVNDIYPYYNKDTYIGMLELRLIPAAHCRSIPSFYKIVYNFV